MGMIKTVQKSRKTYVCNKCGKEMPVGSPYRKVTPFRQPARRICMSCKCREWEFSKSDYVRTVGSIVEDWQETYHSDSGDFAGIIDSLKDELDSVKEDTEDKIQNMEEYNLLGSTAYETLSERRDLLEETINELDYINLEELETTAKEDYSREEFDTKEEYNEAVKDAYYEQAIGVIDDALGILEY